MRENYREIPTRKVPQDPKDPSSLYNKNLAGFNIEKSGRVDKNTCIKLNEKGNI